MPQSIANKILSRIYGSRRGYVFSPSDFLDIATRSNADKVLSRLVNKGVIRRIGRGVYDYPRQNPRIGKLSPSPDAVVRTIGRKLGHRIQPSGARSANALGLTTQVPARLVYYTEGPSRRLSVLGWTIELRHASPKRLAGADTTAGAIVRALRYLGKNNVNKTVVDHLGKQLAKKDKQELVRLAKQSPEWLVPVVHAIAKVTQSRDRHT